MCSMSISCIRYIGKMPNCKLFRATTVMSYCIHGKGSQNVQKRLKTILECASCKTSCPENSCLVDC